MFVFSVTNLECFSVHHDVSFENYIYNKQDLFFFQLIGHSCMIMHSVLGFSIRSTPLLIMLGYKKAKNLNGSGQNAELKASTW